MAEFVVELRAAKATGESGEISYAVEWSTRGAIPFWPYRPTEWCRSYLRCGGISCNL